MGLGYRGFGERTFWQGALFLSVAAIITKVLSAVYRIPYQNIAGDIGFYVYQQIYPFYGIAFILSLYGFPVVISKIISESASKRDTQQVIAVSFYLLFLISACTSIALFIFSPAIASIMGDLQLTLPLQVTAFSFLMIPFLSTMRGYHQGIGSMMQTAVSQVIEQFVRVCLILLFALFFIMNGYGPYLAGTGAAIGSIAGAAVGIMVLFVYFIHVETLAVFKISASWNTIKSICSRLLRDSIFICFSALVFVLFQLVDALSIIRLLQEAGFNETLAKVSKGIYDRGQPLLQLGSVISTAFSLTLVPMIAREISLKQVQKANAHAELALRLSFVFGISAAVGLAIVIEPTNAMLFTNKSDSHVLATLGIAILFSSLVITSSAILQGYDCVRAPARNICIGLLVKLILNWVFIPHFGTLGAASATVFAFALICVLNIITMQRIGALTAISYKPYIAVVRAVVMMGVITYLWLSLAEHASVFPAGRLADAVLSLSSVLLGALSLLIFLLRYNVFTKNELEKLPKSKKLLKWTQRFMIKK